MTPRWLLHEKPRVDEPRLRLRTCPDMVRAVRRWRVLHDHEEVSRNRVEPRGPVGLIGGNR